MNWESWEGFEERSSMFKRDHIECCFKTRFWAGSKEAGFGG